MREQADVLFRYFELHKNRNLLFKDLRYLIFGIHRTPDEIIQAVCKGLGIKKKDLLSKCRKRDFVEARFISYYMFFHELKWGKSKIARYFGVDHSSVFYGIQQYNNLLLNDIFVEKLKQIK